MEITKHDMDMMKGLTKEVADHIRDIDTIMEGRVSCGYMHAYELQKYKEAVIDLFIKEMQVHILPGKFGAKPEPSPIRQDEILQ